MPPNSPSFRPRAVRLSAVRFTIWSHSSWARAARMVSMN